MVVLLTLVHFVGLSLFMSTLLLLMLAGLLALLYHLYKYTHYTLRGGNSFYNANCGAFYVLAHFAADHIGWFIGAALL